MATVNILPAFTYKWAQDTIQVEAIEETQWRAGWQFIGSVPPSVEQFNKVHQIHDEKSNYLYAQMASIFTAAGETPAAGDLNSLRDSLAAIYGGGGRLSGIRVFTASGTYTPTAGTKFIIVRMVGGGGAGGGTVTTGAGACSGGVGGGSGAFVEALLTTGFSGQPMTIGAAGAAVAGASGGSGGVTTFAGLSAGGGLGGVTFGAGAMPLTAAQGNTAVASGGAVNVPGQNGGGLLIIAANAGLSGIGGNGLWGNGGGPANGGAGVPGTGFGSGGSGAISYPSTGVTYSGGAGRPGLIVIEEFI